MGDVTPVIRPTYTVRFCGACGGQVDIHTDDEWASMSLRDAWRDQAPRQRRAS